MSKALCQNNVDIDENMLLGYLFFYNLGEIKISENDLEDIFYKNNLSKNYIRKIGKADAFRRASAKAKQTVEVDYQNDRVKAKIEVDEVFTDSTGILRLMGRKIIDEQNKEVSYESIGKVFFNRAAETIESSVDNLDDEYDYQAVLNEMDTRYAEWSVFHTKDTIRNIILSVLKDMHPVNLLPSGLAKFIPKANKDQLYSLKGVIKDLELFGTGSLFEIIPIIDTDEQRASVNNAATLEIKEDLQLFVEELRQVIIQKQTISSRAATSYVTKFKDLRVKVKEYEDLLGVYMTSLNTQIVEAMNFVGENTEPKN